MQRKWRCTGDKWEIGREAGAEGAREWTDLAEWKQLSEWRCLSVFGFEPERIVWTGSLTTSSLVAVPSDAARSPLFFCLFLPSQSPALLLIIIPRPYLLLDPASVQKWVAFNPPVSMMRQRLVSSHPLYHHYLPAHV